MEEYHKIQTIFKRNPETKFKTLLDGEYSLPVFKYLKDNQWAWTEKIDGTNIRIDWDVNPLEDRLSFGGRTDNAQIPTFLYQKLSELFTKEKMKSLYPETSLTLYGEGYGAKIQKGGGNYISDGVDFILFDVNIGGWWLERTNVIDIAHTLGIMPVPLVGFGNLEEALDFVKKGFNSQWGDFPAEGLVLRPETELRCRGGKRVITKIKYKDFPR